jgi:taurine dioxygenase
VTRRHLHHSADPYPAGRPIGNRPWADAREPRRPDDRGVTTAAATHPRPPRAGRAHRPDRAAPQVARLTGAVGAVITGVDLRHDLDTAHAVIRAALDAHHVVFLPGRPLSDRQLRRLAGRFGPLRVSPLHQLLGTTRTTSVIEDSEHHPPAGFDWHTDLSWTADPPELGFLNALEIPPYGGDTIWVSLAAAWASLPVEVQERCRNLRAVHRPDATLLDTVTAHHGPDVAARLQQEHPPVLHPLLRTHHRTGQPGLFVSPLYTERIDGLSPDDSDTLLATLRQAIEDPHHQIRWSWRPGDVVIWDETATCHRALTDHYPQHRAMRRCVAGTA